MKAGHAPPLDMLKPEKTAYDMVNLYGPEGATKVVSVKKGDTFIPEPKWSTVKPEKAIDETKNDYATFVAGQKEQGITSPTQINKNWHDQKVKEAIKVGVTVQGARTEGLSNIPKPTTTPGVYFKNGKFLTNVTDETGKTKPVELNSEQTKQANMDYRTNVPTESIKTMAQTAPKVIGLIDEAEKLINIDKKNLGPMSSRWRNLWAGKVGTEDKAFIQLKSNVDLLTTLLMRMHVGARGGEYIMQHFEKMLGTGKQSPENLLSALEVMKKYSKSVGHITSDTDLEQVLNSVQSNSKTIPTGIKKIGKDAW
jgi:hypothetical protein